MRMIGGSALRGGQNVFHGLHMWGQLVRAALLLAACCVVAAPVWRVWQNTSGYDRYAAFMATVAETKLGLGYPSDSLQTVRLRSGREVALALPHIAGSPAALAIRENLKREVFAGAVFGAKIAGASVSLLFALFWFRGRALDRTRRVRGAELASARRLERRVRPLRRRALDFVSLAPPPYRIAGVPYPERAETRHTIVSGTTGSGKTALISDLVAQIRARGERCVVYDKMGGYARAFFDPARDALLNPLDARSPRWSPFHEARGPRDFDTMAAALIPQQKDAVDPFWVTAARQLFANGAEVLRKRGVSRNRVLVEHLLKTDLGDLAKAMEGTVAQSIVDPENPRTALSVRAMLTANIGALEFLPDAGEPFSIREWIADDRGSGFLFLTSRGDQHASLRGLISTWLEIAVNAMLSLERDDARRVWVVLDELPTLHQVPSLQSGLAESRQFGGCFVLGVQVISALRDLYGRNGAETISGLCGTRAVLASPDRDTAQWSADSLGRGEVEEMSEGFSYGASAFRDGVSLTPKRELRPLVLASEIMRLDSLRGWLRFPGPLPVAPIRLRWVERPRTAERFVPRPEEGRPGKPPLDARAGERAQTEAAAAPKGKKGERGKRKPKGEPDIPPAPPETCEPPIPPALFPDFGFDPPEGKPGGSGGRAGASKRKTAAPARAGKNPAAAGAISEKAAARRPEKASVPREADGRSSAGAAPGAPAPESPPESARARSGANAESPDSGRGAARADGDWC